MKKINDIIKKYLNWCNNSKKFIKIFQIIFYYVPAILTPLLLLATYIRDFENLFYYHPIFYSVLMLIWIIVFGYFNFKILWTRAKDLSQEVDNKKYFVIPTLGHYIKTNGELIAALCLTLPILLIGIQFLVIFGYNGYDTYDDLFGNIPIMQSLSGIPIAGVVILPLYGYFALIFVKLVSESLTALVDIANNTTK